MCAGVDTGERVFHLVILVFDTGGAALVAK